MTIKSTLKRWFWADTVKQPDPVMFCYVQCQGCGAEASTQMNIKSVTVTLKDPCKRCNSGSFNCHVSNTDTPPEWYGNWEPYVEPVKYEVGDRIKASSECRFDRNFKGVVKYVEPNGTLWVRRDGASSDVFYHPDEVQHV